MSKDNLNNDLKNISEIIIEKSKSINWIVVLAVVVLSYGFVITNPSIGIDDENFDFYFKYNGIVASGRWGSWLIKHVLDSYSYLPVWRDFLAVLILVVAAVIFVSICEFTSRRKIDAILSTSLVSTFIAYPIVARMFVYIDNSVETAMCFLFATAAVAFFVKNKDCHLRCANMCACISLLILGCSLIENTLVYFCIESMLFSFFSNENKALKRIFSTVVLCAIAAVIAKAVGMFLAKGLGIYYSDYGTTSYVRWSEIDSATALARRISKIFARQYHWFSEYASSKAFAIACVFWLAVMVFMIWKRNHGRTLYAAGIVVASFTMYIITMNANLPLRIFTSNVVTVAGAVALVYFVLADLTYQRPQILKCVFSFLMILAIFHFTKESNVFFQEDYKRYLQDVDVARNVNYDLQKTVGLEPDRPIIFVGQPEYTRSLEGNIDQEIALTSIFSNNLEGESIRIHRFFDMLGYDYANVIGEEITIKNYEKWVNNPHVKDAVNKAKKMQSYPNKGYINVQDEVIIVNLGNPMD